MIEIEILLVAMLGALCYIAKQLKQGNDLAAKMEQHLAVLRKRGEPAAPPPLRLTPDDLRESEPRRERARV